MIRQYIPNTITCLSLLSGCYAIVFALGNNMAGALVCIIIAACLDFLDGLAARLLHAYSAVGKELDSLADLVAFGVAPGMMAFTLARESYPMTEALAYCSLFTFAIPVLSALRLAKFNTDERQRESFLGLPVPAHALFWASVCYTLEPLLQDNSAWWLPLLFGFSACLTSLLLVSGIPMFSFKVKSLAWKGNELRYVLVVCGILLVAFAGLSGIAGIIFLYVILSVFNKRR